MISGRKRKIVQDYFEDLFERADFKDFVAEKKLAEKKIELKKKSRIILGTNKGDIELDLYVDEAPLACENFIGLVEKGYYNGIIFHRVVKDFMIQGGDPTGTGQGGDSIWEKPFIDEVNDKLLFDKKGLLAMANSGPNTNKSQFFITVKETPWLNKKHTIFGEIISGYDIVEKIENAEVDGSNKPKEEQKIIKAYIKVNNDNKSKEGEKDDG
ncbi:MAG: peptidylprolyl isomerase [Candidatus Omnitrophica bacterium]|nr:peptidylprolyl isomerase [Candidatus Omnitrophota bacterium]